MFDAIFSSIFCGNSQKIERTEGVSFLKAAASLYDLKGAFYLGVNIPIRSRQRLFRHCCFSNLRAIQRTTEEPQAAAELDSLGLLTAEPSDWTSSERLAIELGLRCAPITPADANIEGLSFTLVPLAGETALFGFAAQVEKANWPGKRELLQAELGILAQYFHSHIMRLNGHDASERILVSARELDCLKCTAEGHTASEASKLLGISERTVRFHLNAAREKMGCANTTEAVARAVSDRMISLSRKQV